MVGVRPKGQPGLFGRVPQHQLDTLAIALVLEFSGDCAVRYGPYGGSPRLRDVYSFMNGRPGAFVRVVDCPCFAINFRAIGTANKLWFKTCFDGSPCLLDLHSLAAVGVAIFAHHYEDFLGNFSGWNETLQICNRSQDVRPIGPGVL